MPYLVSRKLAEDAQNRAVGRKVRLASSSTSYWYYASQKPTAQKLLFVHGYRGTHAGLEAIAGALSEFEVFCPDLPGFGESTDLLPAQTNNAQNYAAWLAEFHRVVCPDAIVVSHSFGTIVAAICAANQSIKSPKWVFINPIGETERKGIAKFEKLLATAFYRLASSLSPARGLALLKSRIAVRAMSIAMAKTSEPKLRKWIHDQHDRHFSSFGNRQVVIDGYFSGESTFVNQYASKIVDDCLLIVGTNDDITPLASEKRLAALFSKARLVEISGVGHLVHYEAPEVAADAIKQFLLTD